MAKDRTGSVEKKHAAGFTYTRPVTHQTLNAPASILRRVVKIGRVGVCIADCQTSGVLCSDCATLLSNHPDVALFRIPPNSGRPCDACSPRRRA